MLLPGLTHTGVHTSKPFVITVSAASSTCWHIIYQLRPNQKYASQTSIPTLHRLTAHSKLDNPQKFNSLPAKLKNMHTTFWLEWQPIHKFMYLGIYICTCVHAAYMIKCWYVITAGQCMYKAGKTKQVIRVKKTRWAAAPTRTVCCLHSQARRQQHVKTMQPHAEGMSTHSFTQAWAHRHIVQ